MPTSRRRRPQRKVLRVTRVMEFEEFDAAGGIEEMDAAAAEAKSSTKTVEIEMGEKAAEYEAKEAAIEEAIQQVDSKAEQQHAFY